jgi:hypothetical protein
MRILVCVSPELLAHFHGVFGRDHTIVVETAPSRLVQALGNGVWDAFVLDPNLGRDSFFRATIDVVAKSSVAVTLYSAGLDATVAMRILYASSRGCSRLVLRGFDDEASSFRRQLAKSRAMQTRIRFLALVADRIRRMPESYQSEVVTTVCGSHVPATVDEFARRIGASRHSLDRWTHRAGLRGPKLLLDSIRLARYRDYFTASRAEQYAVLERAGFDSERSARERCRRVLGVPLRMLVSEMSTNELATQLYAAITRAGLLHSLATAPYTLESINV